MAGDAKNAPKAAFSRNVGFTVAVWRRNYAELRLKIEPRHLNRSNRVHGGVMMTLIDAACGYAGSYDPEAAHPRLTSSLSITVNFLANTTGGKLRTIARRTGGGRSLFFARAEVLDDKGVRLAEGVSTFRYRSDEAARESHARHLKLQADGKKKKKSR
jgi:uncharacterized protein (TIGR00369 family)